MDNAGSAGRSRTATVQLVGNYTVGYDILTENVGNRAMQPRVNHNSQLMINILTIDQGSLRMLLSLDLTKEHYSRKELLGELGFDTAENDRAWSSRIKFAGIDDAVCHGKPPSRQI